MRDHSEYVLEPIRERMQSSRSYGGRHHGNPSAPVLVVALTAAEQTAPMESPADASNTNTRSQRNWSPSGRQSP